MVTAEEQDALRSLIQSILAKSVHQDTVNEWELTQQFPRDVWRELGAAGLLALGIPEDAGGSGGGVIEISTVMEELARCSLALAIPIVTTVSQGAKLLHRLGTSEQKDRYLKPLMAGDLLTTLAWTEPSGGSDVLSMTTKARLMDGEWVLNGTKTFITLADKADVIFVVARSQPVQERRSDGISCFAVPAGTVGMSIRPIAKMAQKSTTFCEINFEDARIPETAVIGTVDNAWREMVPLLSSERTIFAAACIGLARAAFAEALQYASQREAFGRSIDGYQVIQHHLVDMHRAIEAASLQARHAADLEARGEPYAVVATQALLAASEMASFVTDLGLQIMGGYGITDEFAMQRYWRDARVFRVSPVTTEVAKNVIAQALGLPRIN